MIQNTMFKEFTPHKFMMKLVAYARAHDEIMHLTCLFSCILTVSTSGHPLRLVCSLISILKRYALSVCVWRGISYKRWYGMAKNGAINKLKSARFMQCTSMRINRNMLTEN